MLLRNDLIDVLNVISLSRRVLNTIRLGLFWAFFYNFVCVIIATGAFYYINGFKINPMIGALAMSVSSVSVVLNALTINFFKVKRTVRSDGGDPSLICEAASACACALPSAATNDNEITFTVDVEGMSCSHCTSRVEKACMQTDGVISAKASVENRNVVITANKAVDIEQIKTGIKNAGYEVKK